MWLLNLFFKMRRQTSWIFSLQTSHCEYLMRTEAPFFSKWKKSCSGQCRVLLQQIVSRCSFCYSSGWTPSARSPARFVSQSWVFHSFRSFFELWRNCRILAFVQRIYSNQRIRGKCGQSDKNRQSNQPTDGQAGRLSDRAAADAVQRDVHSSDSSIRGETECDRIRWRFKRMKERKMR